MIRLLPLIPLMLWLSWSDHADGVAPRGIVADPSAPWLMLGVIGPVVAILAIWARLLVRRHRHTFAPLPTRRFQFGLLAGRVTIVAWYAAGLFAFGFGAWVDAMLAPIGTWHVRLPGLIVGTWPVLIGWLGLAWAAYPVDRAVREGNLLAQLESGLGVHAPPSLRDSIVSNFRMQVLFLLAPILATVAIRDGFAIGYALAGATMGDAAEGLIFIGSIGLVFIASPELLIRILRAKPLAPSPLRDRLERMARQLKLNYRDILVWHTSYGVGNAAVMGLVPRFRYVLLTDLLIETLDDRQIEAVFAHEAGHVQHRHLLWYVVFFSIFVLCMAGPGDLAYRAVDRLEWLRAVPSDLVVFAGFAALFLALFGMLARLFERQADIYAARSVESLLAVEASRQRDVLLTAGALFRASPALALASPLATPVGSAGAESFVSALVRVAEINHMPIADVGARRAARRNPLSAVAAGALDACVNFLHPSIPVRVEHLRAIARDAARTERFDRKVAAVMLGMIVALMMLAAWVGVSYLRPHATASATPIVLEIDGASGVQ